MYTYRYDGTPPENPTDIIHTQGITQTWQNTTSIANFSWPASHDEGSGTQGYYTYWGMDTSGTSANFITANSYQNPAPLCGINQACVGYLRLRSVDNVNNQAEGWTTAFTLRYDNSPPSVDFDFGGGITQTQQTLVNLNITGIDEGSGIKAMRLSHDGQNWTDWEVYATERSWMVPAISRQSWPVHVQVRDGVGLVSVPVMHEVYFDVNAGQPKSISYRLFDYQMNAGAGEHSSTSYNGRSTIGQTTDSPVITSTSFLLSGGYEAGSQALPLERPKHDEFNFINGVFASGNVSTWVQSLTYQLVCSVGQVGIPSNQTTISSSGFSLQPGFLAAEPAPFSPPLPPPGEPPSVEQSPECEFPRISINDSKAFTDQANVMLSICAPKAEQMMISNDGSFSDAQWEAYTESKAWTIGTYGQQVMPRFVYAAFKEANGSIHAVFFDDVIYDPNPPSGEILVGDDIPPSGSSSNNRGVKNITRLGDTRFDQPMAILAPSVSTGNVDIYVNGRDDNSGIAEMQFSLFPGFAGAEWEPFSALKPWTPEGDDGVKTLFARFKDSAGNVSSSSDTSFVLDTQAPWGGIVVVPQIIGQEEVTATIYLGWEDNLSEDVDMRISENIGFTDAAWQPFSDTLHTQIDTEGKEQGTFYAQFRDLAGNISEVISDTFIIDSAGPIVYAESNPGAGYDRQLTILAYDELSLVSSMRISNDPLFIDDVEIIPYEQIINWTFDERLVVWIQVMDSVGNWSDPYPVYSGPSYTYQIYLPVIQK